MVIFLLLGTSGKKSQTTKISLSDFASSGVLVSLQLLGPKKNTKGPFRSSGHFEKKAKGKVHFVFDTDKDKTKIRNSRRFDKSLVSPCDFWDTQYSLEGFGIQAEIFLWIQG